MNTPSEQPFSPVQGRRINAGDPADSAGAGAVLGDFVLRREIGRGGMGTVYAAFQRSLQREVALKVLGQHVSASPLAVARFRREAQAAAKLHHPSIVPIFALGDENGVYYYAMEIVDGPALNTVITELRNLSAAKIPADDPAATVAIRRSIEETGASTEAGRANAADSTVLIAMSAMDTASDEYFHGVAEQIAAVAEALDYAHRSGVVHRDIKPHNLLFGLDGNLRISDFGLARLAEQPGVTMTGELIGSPLYMSPEQIRGDTARIDHRTDIYSLGATMYEWLSFRPPYPGETREQVISRVLTTEAPPLRSLRPAIPVDLETICLKAISREVSHRYQSAGELSEDLRRFLAKRPVRARRDGSLTRARKLIQRYPLGSFAAAAAVVGALLIWQLVSTKKAVQVQTAVAVQAQEETERLRDTLSLLPLEIAGSIKLAEVARPVLSNVLGTASRAFVPSGRGADTGPDPNRAGTSEGIARRAAGDFYQDIAPPAWKLGTSPNTGELPPGLAQALSFWHNDPAKALDIVSSCLEVNPADFDARQLKTALLARLGHFNAMLSEAEELLRQQQRAPNAFLWRGLAHLFLGNAQTSLTDFGQAVQLSRFSPWSMTLHAVALLHAQRSIEALSVLDGVLADDPEMVIARLCRASVRTSLGNFEGAIADLTEILESEPRNADVMALRGNLYVEVSNFAAAERDYELAMKIAGPNDSVRARWMFTRIQHNLLSPQTPSATPSPAPPPDSAPGAATGTSQTGRAPDSALTGPEATFARALLEGEPTVRQNLSTRWTFGAPRPR